MDVDKYINDINKNKLFQNISEENLKALLPCLNATIKNYSKEQIILHQGDSIEKVGIILEGTLKVERVDFWGNNSILRKLTKNDMFGEIYAFEKKPLEISIISASSSKILFLNFNKIIHPCHYACTFHTTLIINLLQIFATKASSMNKKIGILSKRTIEDKILSYLKTISVQKNSKTFEIPFNRQELADFLVVNRSALSKELMKLKQDGILDFNKNSFTLL
ncbi:MAG: Crp/Fnr family transcriptional regulator [Pleomorphochaeta sp.]|nr:Crp/Fnr family transcriptional regulator [Sphaerochaetaceae bacterium]